MGNNVFDEQKCRICGCTWDNACLGGCYWIEEDLCSECAKKTDERCQKAEWINGKCRGYQISRWNEEPVESCKQCKCFEEHEEQCCKPE